MRLPTQTRPFGAFMAALLETAADGDAIMIGDRRITWNNRLSALRRGLVIRSGQDRDGDRVAWCEPIPEAERWKLGSLRPDERARVYKLRGWVTEAGEPLPPGEPS